MTGGNFEDFKRVVRDSVDERLHEILITERRAQVADVAWYSVRGGHRWRAMVVVAAGRIFRSDALVRCLPAGIGIELAHAASLILDDLPSMDDGKLRRGRPCAHLAFAHARWAVDLAPVFMVNLAYQIALHNEAVGYRERVESAQEMSRTSCAMIVGQELDVVQDHESADSDERRLLECYVAKSGSLYAAAAKVGAITAQATAEDQQELHQAGMELGMAYQFMDDVCDVTATSAQSGKTPGQDAGVKRTAIDLFGVDGARRRAGDYQDAALERLSKFGAGANTMRCIVRNASWAPA